MTCRTLLTLLPLATLAVLPLSAAEPAAVTVRVADGQADFHIGSELAGRYHAEPGVAQSTAMVRNR